MKLQSMVWVLALASTVGCNKSETKKKEEPAAKTAEAPKAEPEAKPEAKPEVATTPTPEAPTPTPEAPPLPPVGLAATDNDPELMALVPEIKTCWTDSQFDDACPAIAKVKEINDKRDPARNRQVLTTLNNWIEEPSDWHIRQFGAVLAGARWWVDDAYKDEAMLGRLLVALEKEPAVATVGSKEAQTADYIAYYAAGFVNETAAYDDIILTIVKDKAFKHPSARGALVSSLRVTGGKSAERLAALTAIAQDTSDVSYVRASAVDGIARVAEADKPKAAELIATLARTDADLYVVAAALRGMGSVGGPEQLPVLLEVLAARDNESASFAGSYTVQGFADYAEQYGWDKKAIAKAATVIVNDENAGSWARTNALKALKTLGDKGFKKIAKKLSKSKDETLAKEAQALLAP